MPWSFKDAAQSAWNFAKFFIPPLSYSYSNTAMDEFSGKTRAALAEQYSASMGLGAGLPPAEGFNTYLNSGSRVDGIAHEKFAEIKIGGQTLESKLTIQDKTPENVKKAIAQVRDGIKDSLAITEATTAARNTFAKDMAELKTALEHASFPYRPQTVMDYLFSIKGEACKAIEAQHEDELEKLDAKLNDKNFLNDLKLSLNLDTDEQVKIVTEDIKATVIKSQKEQLSTFEETLNEPIKKMFSASKERVAFLAMINQIEANRAKILALTATKGEIATRQTTTADANSAYYKNVDLKQLDEIITITGNKVTKSGEQSYSLALPNRLLSPLYYANNKHNVKRDIMMLPLALKARGFDTVTMRIQHPNKEYEKELARTAYEACREAGYDPKDITIQFGEEVIKEEKPGDGNIKRKLFGDCTSRYDAAEIEAKKNQEDWDEVAATQPESTSSFKKKVQEACGTQPSANTGVQQQQQPPVVAP